MLCRESARSPFHDLIRSIIQKAFVVSLVLTLSPRPPSAGEDGKVNERLAAFLFVLSWVQYCTSFRLVLAMAGR